MDVVVPQLVVVLLGGHRAEVVTELLLLQELTGKELQVTLGEEHLQGWCCGVEAI